MAGYDRFQEQAVSKAELALVAPWEMPAKARQAHHAFGQEPVSSNATRIHIA
jgi:hypothetical protein